MAIQRRKPRQLSQKIAKLEEEIKKADISYEEGIDAAKRARAQRFQDLVDAHYLLLQQKKYLVKMLMVRGVTDEEIAKELRVFLEA